MAYAYGILNFAFIAASISMGGLIHAQFQGVSEWTRGEFVPNFTSFFLWTALVGQLLVWMWSRAIGLISEEHAGKQEMLFYAFHVFTAAVLALSGFAKSRGSEGPVANKSHQLLCVSLCWMFVVLAWLCTSHYDEELMAKYHLLRVVAERACNFWKIHLMVWFSEHSIRCTLLRGGFVGRLRAARLVPSNFQAERLHATWDAVPLVEDQFRLL